ncbi:MAG: hypothetical protein HN368_07690 [Spirochaetales bacterium]|jgi:hypothetical protein|nr:hypothetical protein [Spirochaetales bacterium]
MFSGYVYLVIRKVVQKKTKDRETDEEKRERAFSELGKLGYRRLRRDEVSEELLINANGNLRIARINAAWIVIGNSRIIGHPYYEEHWAFDALHEEQLKAERRRREDGAFAKIMKKAF